MTDGADEESVEPKASQPRPSEQKMASGSFALNGPAFKGLDTGSAMSQMLKGLDTGSAMSQMLKGLDTGSAMSQMLKGSDTGSAMSQMLKGSDTGSTMSQMLKGLNTTDLLTRVVGAGFTGPSMPSGWFDSIAHRVLADVGLQGLAEPEVIQFTPSLDDSAYAVLEAQAPDIAEAINAAAEQVTTPFWSTSTVRNSLAWLVAGVVVILYVGGTVLWPPWGAVAVALLSAGGVTAPSVHRSIAKGGERRSAD